MNDVTPSGRRARTRARIIGLVLAVVLLVLAGAMVWHQARGGVASTAVSTSAGRPASGVPSAAPLAPSSAAVPAGCTADPGPIVPVSMRIDRMKISTTVISLGLDANNAAAAPPKDEPSTVAWYDKGPKPGSGKGKVVLSVHTYHVGGALGNTLYDPQRGLRKGDVIRLTDTRGTTVCYRYDHSLKIAVKDYDPASTILYDDSGRPTVAIVICWDYDASAADWDSRVIFYGTPVSG